MDLSVVIVIIIGVATICTMWVRILTRKTEVDPRKVIRDIERKDQQQWDEDFLRLIPTKPEPWTQTPPDRLAAAQRWHREMEAGIDPVMASLTYLGWSQDRLKTKTLADLVQATETQLRKDGGFD